VTSDGRMRSAECDLFAHGCSVEKAAQERRTLKRWRIGQTPQVSVRAGLKTRNWRQGCRQNPPRWKRAQHGSAGVLPAGSRSILLRVANQVFNTLQGFELRQSQRFRVKRTKYRDCQNRFPIRTPGRSNEPRASGVAAPHRGALRSAGL
jgi:hypothetical protein